MSTLTQQKTVPKIRTYAADLDSTRAHNLSTPIPTTKPAIKENIITESAPQENTTPVITPAPKETTKRPTTIVSSGTKISASEVAQESFPAVIITDNKHKRFKLSEAIIDSVTNWWSTKREDARKKKIPKYTVPVAERRKGVIQKATTKTGRTSTADHRAVLDNLKAAKQIPHDTKAPIVKTETKKSDPVWETAEPKEEKTTVNVVVEKRKIHSENDTLLAEQKNNWNSDLQIKVNNLTTAKDESKSPIIITGKEFSKIKEIKKTNDRQIIKPIIPEKVLEPKIDTSTSAENLKNKVIKEDELKPVFVKPKETVTPATRPKIVPVIPPLLNTVKAAADEPEILDLPDTTPEVEALPEETKPQPERRFAPPQKAQNPLLIILSNNSKIIYVALGLILLVGGGAYLFRTQTIVVENNQPTTTIPDTTFINTTIVNETSIAQDKNSIANKIKEVSLGNDSLVEVNFISPTTGNNLTASEFFELTKADILFDFTSSINNLSLGGYRGQPWIAFRISDQATARGGMLNWENKMSNNLDPLFGATVTNSNSDLLTPFYDDIIGTTDVRILKDSAGAEKITYGFVNPNLILITTNTTAFLNLAESLNTY